LLFVPPVGNFFSFTDPARRREASFDYANVAGRYLERHGVDLGTRVTGTVLEEARPDGRAKVTVLLLTSRALTFATKDRNRGGETGTDPLLMGTRPAGVLRGARPALGTGFTRFVFINPRPGARLPDLVEIAVTRPSDFISYEAFLTARGPLRKAFGGTPGDAFGAMPGTRGRLQVTEEDCDVQSGDCLVEDVIIRRVHS
jgi:hypothetical protein